MKAKTSLLLAAGFNTFFFVFHIPFYWMFDWKHTLACLNNDNWAIFQCFNIISIGLLFLMSYMVYFCREDLLNTKLGKALLLFASWFYVFRIIAEFVFFNEPNKLFSLTIIVLCAMPAFFYALPVFQKKKEL